MAKRLQAELGTRNFEIDQFGNFECQGDPVHHVQRELSGHVFDYAAVEGEEFQRVVVKGKFSLLFGVKVVDTGRREDNGHGLFKPVFDFEIELWHLQYNESQ